MRFNQTDMLYKEKRKKKTYKWRRKNLLLNINLVLLNAFRQDIQDMKLQKFQVESVLGNLQGGNYEFKRVVWMDTEKYLKKDYFMNIDF